MTRRSRLAALAIGLSMLGLALGGLGARGADKALDDALFELQLVPVDSQPAPPFELERLSDGKRVTLAEHLGRPVMLYFWATW